MKTIDRMLIREVTKALAVVLLVLLLILLASFLVKLLGRAAGGLISPEVLMSLVGLQVLQTAGIMLPPAFFLALLWVLGGMYRDSEMVALQSGGVGVWRLFRAIALAAIPLALLSAVLSLFLIPWANNSIENIREMERRTPDLSIVRGGRFSEFKRGKLMIYSDEAKSGDALRDIFVQDELRGTLGIVVAESARQITNPSTGDDYVVLRNGQRYEGSPGQAGYSIARFEEYAVLIPKAESLPRRLRTDSRPTLDLWSDDSPRARAAVQFRLSVPFSVLVFALLAVPLARSQPRRDVYGRLGFAILTYFVFLNLQRIAESWMEDGVTPAWLGIWWVLVLMACLAGLLLLLDSPRFSGRLRRLWVRR